MVAKVITGTSIKGALNYNELKVHEGKAECIGLNGFIKEPHALTFYDKLHRFEDLTIKNRRSKTNTLHISLNFDVSEKLSKEELSNIASAYMEKIGFGKQPYLVYQHFDAAHPHVHIVTTSIQNDGKRIALHNIGRNQSEKARKEIEQDFNLVKAETKKSNRQEIPPVNIEKVVYGKAETKRSISNVVRVITKSYKYTSLAELNAVLKQFNVIADRGSEGSKMYLNNGLIYSLLNENGQKIGVPIKASAIYTKPTLAFLQKKFQLNEMLRHPYGQSLKNTIDEIFRKYPKLDRQSFTNALSKKGVKVVFRDNKDGRTYGITFVDHNSKTVFNGSDLGKTYGAKSILEKLSATSSFASSAPSKKQDSKFSQGTNTPIGSFEPTENIQSGLMQIINQLTMPEHENTSPNQLIRKRRKKKRKGYRH